MRRSTYLRGLFVVLSALATNAFANFIPQNPKDVWRNPAACAQLEKDSGGLRQHAIALAKSLQNSDVRERVLDLVHYNRMQEMVWILSAANLPQEHDLLEAHLYCFLLSAQIGDVTQLEGSSTESKHVYFTELDMEAVFKPHQSNYSASIGSEVGAYRLDRLLGLDIVPITIRRKLSPDGPDGSLQYFVKNCVTGCKLDPEKQKKSAELLLFDFFSKNIDRDPKNYLLHPQLNKIIAIDNGWALRGNNVFAKIKALFVDKRSEEEKNLIFPADTFPSPDLIERLRRLRPEHINTALSGVVNATGINKLIKRKEKLLRALDAQAAQRRAQAKDR
jgi:hypothetical protein